jgi:hypothetical protein
MDVTDKIYYYCGIVGICLAIVILTLTGIGVMSGGPAGFAKGIVCLVVGLVLFFRGYRAKRDAGN